ncbi:MAG: transposase [Planctomycetota bacterium]
MVKRRRNFRIAGRFLLPDRLVFLDESGAKTNMTRLYGRSMKGTRCNDDTPGGHWKTMTLLSAVRSTEVIQDATVVCDGAMDGGTFLTYVERCLVPSLRCGDVVVMDNLAAHKVVGVREAIEASGCDLWYLPPYSPDLAPHGRSDREAVEQGQGLATPGGGEDLRQPVRCDRGGTTSGR